MKIKERVDAYFRAKERETEEKERKQLVNNIVKLTITKGNTEYKVNLMKEINLKFSSELDKIEEESLLSLKAISEW